MEAFNEITEEMIVDRLKKIETIQAENGSMLLELTFKMSEFSARLDNLNEVFLDRFNKGFMDMQKLKM